MMLYNIVTITRNNRAGLAKTAASVMEQSCKDFNWIIIDGNSGDGSHDDFKFYARNALIVSESDEGIYDAMNKGLTLADGTYTLFLNAGDRLGGAGTLGAIKESLGADFPDFIYGDALEEGGNGKSFLKPARPHTKIKWGMFTHHQAMLYKTERLQDYRFNPNYTVAADYDLTLRFIEDGASCLYIPLPICVFEKGGVSQRRALTGRSEQFLAKRQKISTLQNIGIFILQSASHLAKNMAPSLYWRTRQLFVVKTH